MVTLSSDSDFHFELVRDLSAAGYGGGDISEVLIAAAQITPGNFTEYYQAFNALSSRALALVKNINVHKSPVSARDTLFRAATYLRSTDFYLHGNQSDPRIISLWNEQVAATVTAISLLPIPGKKITIEADNFTIPAYYFNAGTSSNKRPTIIIGGGYDGGQEELYFQMGQAALERGWNVITYEGPGQAQPRRYQNLGFILEWERVVTPIVDYLQTLQEVDTSAIALIGLSFGGILAPRASAFEHRLAGTVALDGIYEFGPQFLKAFPAALTAIFNSGNATAFDEAIALYHAKAEAANTASQFRWFIDQGIWSFATTSPFEWMTQLQRYTLDSVIDKIPGPIFIGDAASDTAFGGQATKLATALGNRSTYHLFGNDTGVGHAGIGGFRTQNQVVYDWLQDVFEKKTSQ